MSKNDIVESVSNQYKKRAFIYVRVSTAAQAEEGYSIPQQIERLKKYCEAMNWKVAKVYTDDGYSGGDLERPAMQQMIKDIEKGKTDIVLVDKLDRLSRSQFDTLYMIQNVFDANNVAFVSRNESFDTSTPFGKAMVGILAVFAELERSRIKERMRDGKEGRAKEGKYKGGGNIPIGFEYDLATGKLIINEYEAAQVVEVFDLFNKRMPLEAIARTMNEKGYRTKYGEWKSQTLRSVIPNVAYIGKIGYKGNVYDGLHDGIIDEKVFDKAQEIMDERDRTNDKFRPGKRYASPFGGLIWCGHCTAKYHWRINGYNKNGSSRAYYICYSRAKSDRALVKDPNCRNKTYRDRDLEKIVYAEIRKLKSEKGYIEELRDSVDTSSKQKIIKKRIAQIENQISKLMDLYTIDSIDLNTVKAKINPLTSEKDSLENELANYEDAQPTIDKSKVIELVELFEDAIESGDCYAIHDVIAELIDHIVINGENIEIHWKF